MNEQSEARGFWLAADQQQHITSKELKAVRLAVLSFLPLLRGRKVLLHEDNQVVVVVLNHLTSRSPAMMDKLRKLWELIDTNNINTRARYNRSAAKVWADRLSRETDMDYWQLNPRVFTYLNFLCGPHSIDMLATQGNSQLPRYNSHWRDPTSEAVDYLHLPDIISTAETKCCNPPWTFLSDLVQKLRQSGAEAIVIAPYWPAKQ
jgi:ABC-type branched-subunit amino acid transport system substrate-binding protein